MACIPSEGAILTNYKWKRHTLGWGLIWQGMIWRGFSSHSQLNMACISYEGAPLPKDIGAGISDLFEQFKHWC